MKRFFLSMLAVFQSVVIFGQTWTIPERPADAISGSAFIEKVKSMSLAQREQEIYREVSQGNIPESFRQATQINETLTDAKGISHEVEMLVLPDVVAIGADDDLNYDEEINGKNVLIFFFFLTN